MPTSGAVRLAADSHPAAGRRSTQPDRSVPNDPPLRSKTIAPPELFEMKFVSFR